MIQRRHKPYAPYIYHESSKNGCPIGSVSNKYTASKKSRFCACISSRITTVIQITSDHQINYNCFNEPFAVSTCKDLYWDMHGLIFETSIWLLAGSTRFLSGTATNFRLSWAGITERWKPISCKPWLQLDCNRGSNLVSSFEASWKPSWKTKLRLF